MEPSAFDEENDAAERCVGIKSAIALRFPERRDRCIMLEADG